jgi:23S rRNA (cytosine1962-C5)-methyltransferase
MLNLIYNENPKVAQRLFHGRGKSQPGFENLNIDYFPPVILLTAYQEYSLDVLEKLVRNLLDIFADNIKTILIQKRNLLLAPTEVLYGENISEHICLEDGLIYKIKLGANQNIGFFLDMKLGRELLKKYVKDKKVLNLFSYTCAFSVVAQKYGAAEILNLDMSKSALSRGKENHLINSLGLRNVKFFSHDILKSFGLIKRNAPYDFIIIDPPSDQGSSFKVDRDYSKLISRIVDWTNPGAYILTCLNSPYHTFGFLEDCVQKLAPELELIEKCGAPPSFNETDPERGLKMILWSRK